MKRQRTQTDPLFPGEHPRTRAARLAIGKATTLSYRLCLLTREVATANMNVAIALQEMVDAGCPDEAWSRHWREECQALRQEAAALTKPKVTP